MGIVIVLVIWYLVACRNNPKRFQKVRSSKKKWIPILILLALFSGAGQQLLTLSFVLGFMGLPIYVIYRIFRAIVPKNGSREEPVYTTRQQRNQDIPRESQLPKAVPKRIRIVSKFNDKYNLNLTEQQIQTIVESSYISTRWEKLIYTMTQDYTTVHQWFNASHDGWLHLYLRVFNTQTISPDIEQQRQICIESFRQIFEYADLTQYNTPSWDIRQINNRFMTNFDDISFMLAYRFLEQNGIKFKLGKVSVVDIDDDLRQLKEKYADEEPYAAAR